MKYREFFVPATITKIHTYDPREIRKVELTLPETYEVDGQHLPIRDTMPPGSAFLARPFGQRTGKYRRRMYTRSNCAMKSSRILETIVNDTHQEKADTSPWWQSEVVEQAVERGQTVDVLVDVDEQAKEIQVYANSRNVASNNLILEPDQKWSGMRILALAFSTGITPFLSHLRYMKDQAFGKTSACRGVEFILVASARHPRQLIEHEELSQLARAFPEHVQYHPVLTRDWPDDWAGSTGRIIQAEGGNEAHINLAPLLALVPNIERCHVRLCGNVGARDQLTQGLKEAGITPLSFRAETW